jgi:hypothetical protein
MKPIKCLLLSAAVLSFAAMNAAVPEAEDFIDADFLPTVAQTDEMARNGRFRPEEYNVQADENGDCCRSDSFMGYAQCILCCVYYSHSMRLNPPWLAFHDVFIDYKGRCICKRAPAGTPPITDAQADAARSGLSGVVIDPGMGRENRNNRNQK